MKIYRSDDDTQGPSIVLDELNSKRTEHFFSIYDFESIIGDAEQKFYLGVKSPRRCRFCKKDDSEVKFKMEAHVIPQFMGNRNLLSYFECDTCNALFSSYEDSCANYFGVSRTFAQIKGQSRKVPKFKDNKTGLEVSITDEGILITTQEGSEPVQVDLKTKTLDIKTERPSYIPIHIPKTLIKIGYSMLTEADLDDYELTRKFIQSGALDHHFINHSFLRIIGYFIPGPPKYPTPFAQLFKKKVAIQTLCPTRQFVLYYANYCLQIIMPFAKSDSSLQGQRIDQPIFPLLVDNSYFDLYGPYQQISLHLTSNEKTKGEEHKVTFGFTSAEERFV